MFASMARLHQRTSLCLVFIVVLVLGTQPLHLCDAQAPLSDAGQPELGSGIGMITVEDYDLTGAATTAAVPPEILGVWKGTIYVDPDYGSSTFSALLAIVDGNVGEIIGASAHPSVACGGEMRLQSAASDAIITATDYTFGPCLDGTHVLTLTPDGALQYEWHDAQSARVDTGTLSKVGGAGAAMPTGYTGVWKGTVTQVNPASEWTALLALVNGTAGSIVGTYASPTLDCGGELVLLGVSTDSVELLHDITYGGCIDNGVDTLYLVADDTMGFSWRSPDNVSTANGTLVRISGQLNQTCTLPDFGDELGNPMRQDVGDWEDDPYGGTDYFHEGEPVWLPFVYYGDDKDTIANWGCYLTSAAMIVNYYAEQQGSAFRTDPGLLNNWLQHNNGYDTGDPKPSKDDPQYVDTSLVRPAKVAEYANREIRMAYIGQDRPIVTEEDKETIEEFVARTRATVDASMCALDPIIMGVTSSYGQHFVDATGTVVEPDLNTWRIHDPAASTPTTLEAAYSNTYNQIARFSDGSPGRVLSIGIDSPIEIVVTDPAGRRTGYDPRTDTAYHEIPGSSYGVERLAALDAGGGLLEKTILDITAATLGDYTLQAIGTGSGSFALGIMATNDLGEGILTRLRGETDTGSVTTYSITYSSSTGQPVETSELLSIIYLPIIAR